MSVVLKNVEMIDSEATGRLFRAIRLNKSKGLNATARAMGIAGATLSLLERGRRNWSEDLVEKFQRALRK